MASNKKHFKGLHKSSSVSAYYNDLFYGYSNTYYGYTKPCHNGFIEVYDRIYCGRKSDINKEILSKVDLLVPIEDVNAKIWDMGYTGEILYTPIDDFDILPIEVEKMLVDRIKKQYDEGKTIAIFCLGGHGRTGYLTSMLLNMLGIDDPVKYLRSKYCENAVESMEQLKAVAEFCNNPRIILNDVVHKTSYYPKYEYKKEEIKLKDDFEKNYFKDIVNKNICGDCGCQVNNFCWEENKKVGNADIACEMFLSMV